MGFADYTHVVQGELGDLWAGVGEGGGEGLAAWGLGGCGGGLKGIVDADAGGDPGEGAVELGGC